MTSRIGIKAKRHPVRNFIILPELAWPYIIRVVVLVNLAGVLMATSICALFYLRFGTGPMAESVPGADPVNEAPMSALMEENLMDVVISAFVISDVVSLVIGLWFAFFFSRRVSVPIYRVRKWAEAVVTGDLAHRIKFRPGDDLQMLEDALNKVSAHYATVIDDLRRQLDEMEQPPSPRLLKIKSILSSLRT